MFTLNITCMTLYLDKPSIGVIWERCGQAQSFQLCQVTLSGSLSRLKNISLSFFSRLMIKYEIVLLMNFQFGPIGPFCRYQVGTWNIKWHLKTRRDKMLEPLLDIIGIWGQPSTQSMIKMKNDKRMTPSVSSEIVFVWVS